MDTFTAIFHVPATLLYTQIEILYNICRYATFDTLLILGCRPIIKIYYYHFYCSDLTDRFCSPCGGCRQIIAEFGHSNDCLVLLVNPSREIKEITIKALLPNAFHPEILLN